jgi:glycine betaine/proline transport system ATP-binding protein
MAAIEVRNLYKIFGPSPERAFSLIDQGLSKEDILDKTGCTIGINNASFSINKKEIFVVMGLSGSGKSTVIRCLNRLIEPTRGEVLIDGTDICNMGREELMGVRRDKLSMVFQHFGLFPHRTVLANVEYGLEVSGEDKETRQKKAEDALALVGLKGYEASFPSELSGGMQQRVGLARALANDPEVLLMDEAFSALDPLIRTQMQDELLDLQAKMHKTIVFITHDLDEALKIGDRIVIMKDGAIVQIGTPEEILTEPADDYVKAFVQNVDRTKVITASSIMKKAVTVTLPKDGAKMALRTMEKHGISSVFVLGEDRKLLGLLTVDDAVKADREKRDIKAAVYDDLYVTSPETPIADLLTTAMSARYPISVTDEAGTFLGMVDRATILNEVLEEPTGEHSPTPLSDTLSVDEQPAAATTGDAS